MDAQFGLYRQKISLYWNLRQYIPNLLRLRLPQNQRLFYLFSLLFLPGRLVRKVRLYLEQTRIHDLRFYCLLLDQFQLQSQELLGS